MESCCALLIGLADDTVSDVDRILDLRFQRFKMARYFWQRRYTPILKQQLQEVGALLVPATQHVYVGRCEQAAQKLQPLLVAERRIAQVLDNLAVGQ
jgi:hypothetical protein